MDSKDYVMEAYINLKDSVSRFDKCAYLVRVVHDIEDGMPVEIEGWHDYAIKNMKRWGTNTTKKADGISTSGIECGVYLVVVEMGLVKVVATVDKN